MITVKDFAAMYGCSEAIVYRHIRNHKEDLGDRVQKEHGKTWLTDEGADYIRGLMKQAPVVVSETSEEVARLRQQLDDANAAFQKYAAETAALLIKASEQIALAERSEANQQRAERLEAQNADLSAELGQAKEKIAQAEKTAQEASDELTKAKEEIERMKHATFWQRLRGFKE